MIRGLACALMVLVTAGGAALAAENFIPRRSYSPDNETLPPLNSERDRINLGADLLESEIFVQQRERKEFESRFNHFLYDQQPTGGDVLPDY